MSICLNQAEFELPFTHRSMHLIMTEEN